MVVGVWECVSVVVGCGNFDMILDHFTRHTVFSAQGHPSPPLARRAMYPA